MGKRRADAAHCRFTDEFPSVRVSRLRANGTIVRPSAPRSSRSPTARGSSSTSRTSTLSTAADGPSSSALAAPSSPKSSTPSTASRSAGDAVTSSTSGIAANGAWAARSACEPPIKVSPAHQQARNAEPLRLNGAPASWGGKAQFVYNRTPHRVHAAPHDHAQAQSARKSARPGRRPPPHPRLQTSHRRPGRHP